MIKIILAEDHLVVRNGIKLLLDSQEDFDVIGEANNGQELLDLLESGLSPDIVIADIHMPMMTGLELAERLAKEYPVIKFVLLTMNNTADQVLHAFAHKARGYLSKNIGYDELLFALKHISEGGKFVSEEIAMILVDKLNEQGPSSHESIDLQELDISERELEVLQLISEGFTNAEIADKLFLSKRTVEGHRQNLINKAKAKNTAQLIKFAVQHRLVD